MIERGKLEDGVADSTQIKEQLVQRGWKGLWWQENHTSLHDGKGKRLGENFTPE